MKKLSFLLLLLIPAKVHAIHTIIFRNANDLSTGSVANNLIDGSSITKQANTFNGAGQLAQYDASNALLNTIGLSVGGVFSARGSTVNCQGAGIVCTGSGQSLTLQVNGSSAAQSNVYTAVIGTSTARTPTYVGVGSVPFITAVFDLCGASNATNCPQNATIFVQNGVYNLYGSTFPKGLTWVFESSAVLTNGQTNRTMITQYGETWYPRFDIYEQNSQTFPFIDYKSGARQNFGSMVRATFNSTTSSSTIFRIKDAADVRIFKTEYSSPIVSGGNIFDLFVIDNASDVWVQNCKFGPNSATGGTDAQFYIKGGNNINITDNDSTSRIMFVFVEAYKRLGRLNIARNTLTTSLVDSAAGLISIQTGAGGVLVDTGTLIADNVINVNDATASRNVITINDNTGGIFGVIVSNNMATGPVGNGLTFLKIFQSSDRNTIVKGNTTTGITTFLNDTGTGTQSATLGNFKDLTQQ